MKRILRGVLRRLPFVRGAWHRTLATSGRIDRNYRKRSAQFRKSHPRLSSLYLSVAFSSRFSRRRIVSSSGTLTISMTTHGKRLADAHYAIAAVGRGTVRPRRMILWLDDPKLIENLPAGIRRLRRRGLEIIMTENYGVHTKYYPYVLSEKVHTLPVITCDDDLLYPKNWLERLLAAGAESPGDIVSYRCHRISFDGDTFADYQAWPRCLSTEPSLLNFSTGVSGQMIPPVILNELLRRGEAFRAVAPRNDDVWIHATATHLGIPTRQVDPMPHLFPFVPGTQEVSLQATNVWQGGNNQQMLASYPPEDVAKLREAALADQR